MQRELWRLARRQHWVVTWDQLIAAGLTRHAIDHRVATGRLYRLYRGVFAVGRSELDQLGKWMAAVLASGEGAVLSHKSAAALWGISPIPSSIEVSVPRARAPRPRGVVVHRRSELRTVRCRKGIPLTSPTDTIVDLAASFEPARLERVINEADKLCLVDPDQLRAEVDGARRPGAKRLRNLLDTTTFVLTDSELEARFVPIARDAGLPQPETQVAVHGHRVDFFFRELGLVVETDGLRYHRTPTQQKRDRVRDQELTAAGLRVLRFTHGQITHERHRVADVLRRLSSEG